MEFTEVAHRGTVGWWRADTSPTLPPVLPIQACGPARGRWGGATRLAPTRGLSGVPAAAGPGNLGHTASHGGVGLTKWDGARLAALVKPGTAVTFK